MGLDFLQAKQYEKRSKVTLLLFLFSLISIVPFLSKWRVGPLSSFYLESGSLLFALLLVLLTVLTGRLQVNMPRGTVYFLLLAAFWWLQARMMELPYYGQSDMVVWTFVILALAAWACRGWVVAAGQAQVVTVLAWALMLGGLLQAGVVLMQFTGWAASFPAVLDFRGSSNITGQLAQRNHLGHYLMWGTLAAAYLWAERKIPTWLGAGSVLFLTTMLGLVNSRTILLYVMAVGALVLWWRWRAGKTGNRVFAIFLGTLAMVVLVQFSLNTVLGWLGEAKVETALARVESSSFAKSAREIEWNKAWQVFQSAPIWGHGWGSFSLQGVLASQTAPYSTNLLSVLFTHTHNIVLQLLTEMGAVGTLLVLGGALWVVFPLFQRPLHAVSLLPLALITVSLCHSMLEYPLWYIYFLVPFALMMSVTPASNHLSEGKTDVVWLPWAVGGVALILLLGLLRLSVVYHDFVKLDSKPKTDTSSEIARKIEGLRNLAQNESLLAYYADLALSNRAAPTDAHLQPWAAEATARALTYRPFSTAYKHALYQYRLGNRAEAAQWMQYMYHYYPHMIPFYRKQLQNSPYFAPLYPELEQTCATFRSDPALQKSCPLPATQQDANVKPFTFLQKSAKSSLIWLS